MISVQSEVKYYEQPNALECFEGKKAQYSDNDP